MAIRRLVKGKLRLEKPGGISPKGGTLLPREYAERLRRDREGYLSEPESVEHVMNALHLEHDFGAEAAGEIHQAFTEYIEGPKFKRNATRFRMRLIAILRNAETADTLMETIAALLKTVPRG